MSELTWDSHVKDPMLQTHGNDKVFPTWSGFKLAKLSSGPMFPLAVCTKPRNYPTPGCLQPEIAPLRGTLPRLGNSSPSILPDKYKHTELPGHNIVGPTPS